MNPRSPSAFLLSTTFHAFVIAVVCLLTLDQCQREKPAPRVLELVAGAGDNFGATVAPKLGSAGGVKVDLPAIPIPKAPEPEPIAPPAPAKAEPLPPEPTPAPTPPPKAVPAPPKKAEPTTPNFAKQVLRKALNAERKAKAEVAKERAAEEKRIKKEEFDRLQRERAKVAAATKGSTAPKYSKLDPEGIAKGVIGGSPDNKVGGAGGKALAAVDGTLMERYFAMLKQRVVSALDKPPGVSDDLVVTIVVHIAASGRLSGARVLKSSGSEEWDRAVIAAFSRVSMPEHPERKNEDLELSFRTQDIGEN